MIYPRNVPVGEGNPGRRVVEREGGPVKRSSSWGSEDVVVGKGETTQKG